MVKLSSFKKDNKSPACSAVILAAGSSERFGSDKLSLCFDGVPMLALTISAFQKSEKVSDIIVVTKKDKLEDVAQMCNKYGYSKVKTVVVGGNNRLESSYAGVMAVRPSASIVLIHDGDRPFVSQDVITKVAAAAETKMAAAPFILSDDTLKLIGKDNFVQSTVDRDSCVRIQTPQAFNANIIKGALSYAVNKRIKCTDDCSVVELTGIKPLAVEGDRRNIKITTDFDYKLAKIIYREGWE